MTSSRIEPAVNNRKKSLTNSSKKFLVPETVTESFEWVASGGRGAKTSDILKLLGIQAILAICMIFIPFYALKFTKGGLEHNLLICGEKDMNSNFELLDMVRVSITFGMGWLVYVLTMSFLHFIVILIKRSRNRQRSIPSSAQKAMETIRFMGPYISLCFGVAALSILIKYYYPGSKNISDVINNTTTGEASTAATAEPGGAEDANDDEDAKDDKGMDKAFTIFINFIKIVLTFGENSANPLNLRSIIPIIVNTFAVFVVVLTVEKFVLQMIVSSYRSATTAGRFTENAFSLSVIKALFRTKLESSTSEKLGKIFDPESTGILFDALAIHDGESEGDILKLEHLESDMEHEQAAKLFGLLDVAQNGDLTKEEFVAAVKAIYSEQETLSKLIHDHDDIISKLDDIMLIVVYSIDFALCLTFLNIPGLEMFTAILGIMVAFGLFFKDALTKAFDSLVLVLVTHPYDLGDRVEIEGKYLYVESVGLWTTTFIGPGGLKTIMNNASLADATISNFRRSPSENEIFKYLVNPDNVTDESIKALKDDCAQFFKENNRDFLPTWHIETYDQIDSERLKMQIKIFHRHNFQNEEAKNERSQNFALFFKDALIRNGFVFSPSYPKAIVAPM